MSEKEEQGISLGDIFHWIFKGKLVGAIAGFVVLVICLIGTLAIMNPQGLVYEVEFDYSSIPGIGSGSGYYIDGTRFSYLDIITEDNVNLVLEQNKVAYSKGDTDYDYSSIKIDELYASNSFTIDVNRIYYDALVEGEAPELKATHYLISMPQSVFKNSKIAREFAKDLINVPLNKTLEMINLLDFTTNLDMYDEVDSFTTKLTYLTNQVNLLQNGYSSFNNSTNGTQYMIDGVTYNFQAISARISDFLATKNYSIMADEIRQIGYVSDKEVAKNEYTIQMEDLVKDHEYLEKQLASATKTYNDAKEDLNKLDSSSALLTTDQVLALLTQLNTTLLDSITSLNNQILANEESQRVLNIKIEALDTLTDEENNAFEARLDAIKERLVTETQTYDLIYKTITGRNMYTYYVDSNVIRSSGDKGALIKYVLPVVLGVVVTVATAWGYGYSKCKKKENEATIEETLEVK